MSGHIAGSITGSITGATRLYAILGDPVAPLRSPALFNAAFARLGRDAAFLPLQVPEGPCRRSGPGCGASAISTGW
ncbi:hypothetical protein [Teichococcus aestuarii]|uniref:hypothetical protein n=1 Tax=Teichococcus aestuarii TaxID=568898 RepID=UPI003616BE96